MKKQLSGQLSVIVGVICAFGSGLAWGFSGNCGQYLCTERGLDATWVTAVRLLSAGLIMVVPLLIKTGGKALVIFKERRDRWELIGFGILGMLISSFTYLEAIKYMDAGTTTVLQYIGPVLILIYECVRKLRLPRIAEAVSIVLSVSGVFLLATGGDIGSLKISSLGLFWGLFSALGLVFYTVIPPRLLKKFGSIEVCAFGVLIGGVLLFVISGAWNVDAEIDIGIVAGIAGMSLFGTIGGYGLYLQGVKMIGVVKTSLIACVEPVAAAVISVVWFGTKFSFTDIIAFAMILATVVIINLTPENKPKNT